MDFISDFQQLLLSRPVYNLRSVHNTNCPYVHMVSYSKDSYLCFGGYKCEDCGYCHYPNQLRDCWDTYFCIKCELCYECVSCTSCYSCNFCTECINCTDCSFCYDCRGCNNCFGCVGLRQKEFYIFNEAYSKEAYFEKVAELKKEPASKILEKVEELRLKHPHIASVQTNSQDCVGDHIVGSKNCYWAFATTNSQDCAYVFHNEGLKDSLDTDLMAASELIYECTPGYDLYNCNFCLECGNVKNAEYSVRCFNSHDIFGCVARDHAEYEILNVKYPKEEYFKKVAEIKDQLRVEKKYTNWLPDVV